MADETGVKADGEPEVRAAPIASLRAVGGANPDLPISMVEPRLRLGTLIRRARASSGTKLEDIADVIGLPASHVMQVENGNLPLSAEKLQQIATMTKCDYESLIAASRDFQASIWNPSHDGHVVGDTTTGRARSISMPPEQVYVEFREGWFAGASGRPNPGDMSPSWDDGHETGRLAMETAFAAKRSELDIHYGDGERGGQ